MQNTKEKITFLKDWTPVECEKCTTVCVYRKGIGRIDRSRWQTGAIMIGLSTKYPGRIAAYCKFHSGDILNPK